MQTQAGSKVFTTVLCRVHWKKRPLYVFYYRIQPDPGRFTLLNICLISYFHVS